MLVPASVLLTALVLGAAASECENKLDYCEQVKEYCTCSVQRNFMRTNCPVTCGYCTPTSNPVTQKPKPCVDKDNTCPIMKKLCTMLEETKEICPLTCGVCTPSAEKDLVMPVTQAPPITTKAAAKEECADKFSYCKQRKHLCTCPRWGPETKRDCPLTCGMCKPSEGGVAAPVTQAPVVTAKPDANGDCEDKFSHCKQRKHLCTCPRWGPDTRRDCPVTCGLCTPEAAVKPVTQAPVKPTTKRAPAAETGITRCIDMAKNCAEKKFMCTSAREAMKKICPVTCGFCTPTGDDALVDPNCKDLTSSCGLTKSLCTTRKEMMMKNCPLTCGFCGSSGSAAKPVTQAPAKPVTQAPAKPVTQAPAKPVTQAPAKPVTQAPAKPVTQAPAKPVTQAPAKPVTQAPAKPVTQAPAKPPQQTSDSLSCSGTKMTPELRAKILDKHNSLRSRLALGNEKISDKEGMAPGAKNMYKLVYDCDLEKAAQKWADTCPNYRVKPHSEAPGENMYFYFTSGSIKSEQLLEGANGWWGELQKYGMKDKGWRFTSDVSNSGVGHFTAMAWGLTTRLGCATATNCKSDQWNMGVLCCQYLQAGNMGNAPIYEIGSACKKDADCTTYSNSKCDSTAGLCVAP